MERITFLGNVVDEPMVRLGHIGCGSHSFRNLFAAYQFTPVELVATCDLDEAKARAYARKFGARAHYTDYREMIDREELDAVAICVGFDGRGRPLYPQIGSDCMRRGVHVFFEKPPAATAAEMETMMAASKETGKIGLCGLKRMFFQMTTKAKQLIDGPDFGEPMLTMLQREEFIPTMEEFGAYWGGEPVRPAVAFLDHFCHPASRMLYLAGMPQRMIYHRAASGAGVVTYEYDNGRVASMSFTKGGSGVAGGVERVTIVGTKQRTVVIENCRVYWFQGPASDPGVKEGYGDKTSYFTGPVGSTTALWEPEFQLGRLCGKGLFLLGYYDEVLEFARSVLEKRQPTRGTLLDCWRIAHMFEKFAEGPGKMLELRQAPEQV